MSRWNFLLQLLCALLTMSTMVSSFTTAPIMHTATSTNSLLLTTTTTTTKSCQYWYSSSQLNAIKPPKKTKLTKEELSFLEVRDMTRDEMLALNAENERVMNQELTYMTVFSLIISAPLLYLAWVGFFAETAEIAM